MARTWPSRIAFRECDVRGIWCVAWPPLQAWILRAPIARRLGGLPQGNDPTHVAVGTPLACCPSSPDDQRKGCWREAQITCLLEAPNSRPYEVFLLHPDGTGNVCLLVMIHMDTTDRCRLGV
jgi:hypothetical protein